MVPHERRRERAHRGGSPAARGAARGGGPAAEGETGEGARSREPKASNFRINELLSSVATRPRPAGPRASARGDGGPETTAGRRGAGHWRLYRQWPDTRPPPPTDRGNDAALPRALLAQWPLAVQRVAHRSSAPAGRSCAKRQGLSNYLRGCLQDVVAGVWGGTLPQSGCSNAWPGIPD